MWKPVSFGWNGIETSFKGLIRGGLFLFQIQSLEDDMDRFDADKHVEWRRTRLSKSHSESAVPLLDGFAESKNDEF